MATEKVILHDTAPAGADLSTKQYTLVKKNGSGQLVSTGAGDPGYVLQDAPASGRYGTIALSGITKVIAGGTVAYDDFLSSDASSHVVTATVASSHVTTSVVGKALKAGVSGDVIPMLVAVSPA